MQCVDAKNRTQTTQPAARCRDARLLWPLRVFLIVMLTMKQQHFVRRLVVKLKCMQNVAYKSKEDEYTVYFFAHRS